MDAHLEADRTPVDELDRALRLDLCDSVDVLRHNVASVQQATGQVLAVTRVVLLRLAGSTPSRSRTS